VLTKLTKSVGREVTYSSLPSTITQSHHDNKGPEHISKHLRTHTGVRNVQDPDGLTVLFPAQASLTRFLRPTLPYDSDRSVNKDQASTPSVLRALSWLLI
jgi:hypothetical protein